VVARASFLVSGLPRSWSFCQVKINPAAGRWRVHQWTHMTLRSRANAARWLLRPELQLLLRGG